MKPTLQSLIITLLLALLGGHSSLQAQTLLRCTEFRTGRDMIDTKVQCALQDREGMLWFGTNVGLCRYDGQAFQNFCSTPENDSPLTSNYVFEICEQPTQPGYIWVVTLNQQVYRFCIATSRFEPVLPMLNVSSWTRLMARRYRRVLYPMAKNQAMWVVLSDGSCARFTYRDPSVNEVWTVEEQGKSRTLYNIYEDQHGREWLLTDRGPRIHGRGQVSDYPFTMITEARDTVFLGSKDGYLASYTDQGGLHFLEQTDSLLFANEKQAGELWPPADVIPCKGEELPDEPLRELLVDRQGNHWMLGENALYRVSLQKRETSFLPIPIDDQVGAILLEDANHLLFGTMRQSVIGRLNLSDGSCQFLASDGRWVNDVTSFTKGAILSLCNTHDGSLWVGTRRSGLYRLSHGGVEHFMPGDSLSINSSTIRSMFEDEYHRLWIGTWGGGLNGVNLQRRPYVFNHRGNSLRSYPGEEYNNVQSVSGDNNGHIMVGTPRGLLTFSNKVKSPAELRYYIHTRKSDNPNSLPVNPVTETFFDQEGTPIVCTYGFNTSVIRKGSLLSDTAYFETHYNLDFPESNTVLSGTVDRNGNIWTVSERGIQRYHVSTGCFDFYHTDDLGFDIKMTDCAMRSSSDGRMFVGADGGILTFHCDSLRKSGFSPQVVFTDVSVDGSHRLTVHLASLDFRPNSKRLHFGYWLEGFDSHWQYTDHPNLVFTNLQPGHYVLHARSINSEGSWTDNESTLPIDIPMTWDNSWYWTYVLLALLIMGAVLLYVVHRLQDRLHSEQQKASQLQLQLDETHQELQRTSVALDVAKASIPTTNGEDTDPENALPAIQEPKTWGMSITEIEQMEEGDRQFLERIQQYVLENMGNPDLEVGELADVSLVSRTSFYRRLKQLSGLSPVDFIRQQRIECAKSLIVEGKDTISEIAYKVGFSDPKYFSKCFKKYVGLTPQDYRQMVKAEKKE